MRDYTNKNPQFSETIKVVDETTPVDAQYDNIPIKAIHDNTLVLKEKQDEIGLATEEEVREISEKIMEEFEKDPETKDDESNTRTATDEEIGEVISGFDDIL